jgi:hypothetical protein
MDVAVPWHGFFRLRWIMDMGELILGIFLITGTYVGSAAFAIILFRLFFPLRAKTAEKSNLNHLTGDRQNSLSKNTVPILSVDGRRGWVKVNT